MQAATSTQKTESALLQGSSDHPLSSADPEMPLWYIICVIRTNQHPLRNQMHIPPCYILHKGVMQHMCSAYAFPDHSNGSFT